MGELFKQAILIWQDLSKADRHNLQDYFLCICAGNNQYEIVSLPENEWLDCWRKFYKQRQGRLPKWMQTFANRLKFKWPD